MNEIHWLDYDTYRGTAAHTVGGHVVAARDIWSPQLGNRRDVLVYLPPSYETVAKARYPVIYMQDGQNLFDETTSFVGEWGVDKTLDRLARERGLETIVVALPNGGEERMAEYSPYPDPDIGGGRGNTYLAFVVETVKPLIDRSFRTFPDRAHTAIAGSSMGGLISLYAFFALPAVFGGVVAMSPSLMFAQQALFSFIRFSPFVGGRVYFDIGGREFEPGVRNRLLQHLYRMRLFAVTRRMRDLLVKKGYHAGKDMMYVEDPGGIHHEAAWARRLPGAVAFLSQGRW